MCVPLLSLNLVPSSNSASKSCIPFSTLHLGCYRIHKNNCTFISKRPS